uniref:Uncharacterized protein n=1 Tax=Oryza sativa subsp. japonica TaxID=39947 RepID=Q6YZS0_ORYSJ|nr:hypothetical protein [Oryza sativa Japonica Group]
MATVEPDSGRAHGYDNGSVEVSGGTAEAENGTRGSAGRRRRPAGNDGFQSITPFFGHCRAIPCPLVRLPGEKPVSVLFETLTDSGGGAFVIYLLGGVV